jgi:hypothetical protein
MHNPVATLIAAEYMLDRRHVKARRSRLRKRRVEDTTHAPAVEASAVDRRLAAGHPARRAARA